MLIQAAIDLSEEEEAPETIAVRGPNWATVSAATAKDAFPTISLQELHELIQKLTAREHEVFTPSQRAEMCGNIYTEIRW